MPIPKRWIPINRDLNDDPEVWQLTDRFGDKALRLWIEVLGIFEKTENKWLNGARESDCNDAMETLSRKVRMHKSTVAHAIAWMIEVGWIDLHQDPEFLSARAFYKYRRRAKHANGEVPHEQPDAAAIHWRASYIAGIAERKFSAYFDRDRVVELVIRYHSAGVPLDEIESYSKISMCWSHFKDLLEERPHVPKANVGAASE